jgi:peptidoglycan hydrolase CwlO-like protein
MSNKTLWLIIIVVILLSAIFLWYNHTSTQETLIKAQETIEETKQALRESREALDKIDKIAKEMKDVTKDAEKAGDEYVKEIKFVSDDEFLNVVNEYSTLMVERVKQLE